MHAEALLQHLTGAEAAVVVNNNAAATLLVLAALAHGREVIMSRAELVEIGGGFRVPDIMRQSGAILREVGTTNRTRVADYAAAISDRTAVVLRVHPSNFRMDGFVERPDTAELVEVAHRFGVLMVEDLGSGNVLGRGLGLSPGEQQGLNVAALDEPTVRASLDAGYDVVSVSGDKLLGGPQAGIVLGRRDALTPIRRHPLMRALRVDKLTYAALEATILEHLAGRARDTVPVARMIALPLRDVAARADALARQLQLRKGPRGLGRGRLLHHRGRQRPRVGAADAARRAARCRCLGRRPRPAPATGRAGGRRPHPGRPAGARSPHDPPRRRRRRRRRDRRRPSPDSVP